MSLDDSGGCFEDFRGISLDDLVLFLLDFGVVSPNDLYMGCTHCVTLAQAH